MLYEHCLCLGGSADFQDGMPLLFKLCCKPSKQNYIIIYNLYGCQPLVLVAFVYPLESPLAPTLE